MCPQREGSTHFPLSIWPYAQLFQESVFVGMCCVLSCFSCVQLFATLWTIALQAPLSMGFPRQEYQSGLPFPSPGDPPNLGIEPRSPISPVLAGRFFTTSAIWEALFVGIVNPNSHFITKQSNTRRQEAIIHKYFQPRQKQSFHRPCRYHQPR